MIPNERGKDLTLSQCYYGDEDHQPIKKFVEEMNRNPELWLVSKNIEGLVTRLTVHAAGVIVLNGAAYERNSKMKTNSGVVVTAYNLGDSEYMGGLKYDFLTVQALDKIRTCMNLLLEDGIMEWKGSLRQTYNHYLLPSKLEYNDEAMWKKLCDGDIIDVFQYDTQVGSQAIKKIRPQSIVELAVANSVMRLMSGDGGELPLETYVRFKNNINYWYSEMRGAGLNEEEIQILEKYLKPLSGVADSQEAAMLLSMDERVAGFSVKDANKLRKAIAKKKVDVMEEVRQMFYSNGESRGVRKELLDYVWNVQIYRQAGYSFSVLHTMGYSTIALQEMNLVYRFPDIYWKTACLSTNANAVNEEDYEFLIEEEIITELDEEDKKEGNKVQYGKVASALIDFKQNDTKIILPNINKSKLGFAPDLENNAILFGLKGITKIGSELIMEIFKRRPFTSLSDFIWKMNGGEKSLISKDKIVNLIKSGCFDEIENKGREEILKDYLASIADTKKNLTLQNMQMLIKNDLLPYQLEDEIKIYNFTKLLRKNKDADKNNYVLDDVYFQSIDYKYPEIAAQVVIKGDKMLLPMKIWDNFYSKRMDVVRKYIELHKKELLDQINKQAIDEITSKYGSGSVLDWEMEALNFYHSGHPLDHMDLSDLELTPLQELQENEITSQFTMKTANGPKQMPIYKLRYICGSVIDKNKAKGIVTLQCQDGVIDVKLFKQQYARYSHVISSVDENNEKIIIDDSFFEKGTHLLICGIKRSDMFVPKTYRNTGHDAILKIIQRENGSIWLATKM